MISGRSGIWKLVERRGKMYLSLSPVGTGDENIVRLVLRLFISRLTTSGDVLPHREPSIVSHSLCSW